MKPRLLFVPLLFGRISVKLCVASWTELSAAVAHSSRALVYCSNWPLIAGLWWRPSWPRLCWPASLEGIAGQGHIWPPSWPVGCITQAGGMLARGP